MYKKKALRTLLLWGYQGHENDEQVEETKFSYDHNLGCNRGNIRYFHGSFHSYKVGEVMDELR